MTRHMSSAIGIAVVMLAAAAALKYGRAMEIIGPDAARRTIHVTIGLILTVYGNYMPKQVGRWRATAPAARVQSALRVGGWSMTLAGLGQAALWAFAPIPAASPAAMALVACATLVTVAYATWACVVCRRTEAIR